MKLDRSKWEEQDSFIASELWEIERDVRDAIELDRIEEKQRRLREEEDEI